MKQYGNKLDTSKALINKTEAIELLKNRFPSKRSLNTPCSGTWVLEDGTLLDCGAHGNIDKFLIEKGYIENLSSDFDVYDGSQFMDAINAVRIRNEVPHLHYPAYLTLPENKLTSEQWAIIKEWITSILTNISTYLIVDCDGFTEQYYNFQAEEALSAIRIWYRTKQYRRED